MTELQELREAFEEVLSKFTLPSEPENLYLPIQYTINNGGKRMRPLLVLLGCKLFNDDLKNAVHPALGIELFHNFTLVHDDIMDNAPLRRGNSTVHEKWNDNVAILSGDAIFIKAYQELVQTRAEVLPQTLEIFNRTALEICEGQQLDMEFESRENVSITDYIHMITNKTAVLLGCSLQVGALIGGASEKQSQLLYDFGLNAGIAFQLQDDILDVFGESQKVGKQKGGDIIANKKTFLLLKALELADGEDNSALNKWLDRSNAGDEKVAAVTAIYNELNVRELAEAEMWKYFNKGLQFLSQVEGNEKWKTILEQFATKLMHRES
jgi:geranylgeranyl diphosphate synthase type II